MEGPHYLFVLLHHFQRDINCIKLQVIKRKKASHHLWIRQMNIALRLGSQWPQAEAFSDKTNDILDLSRHSHIYISRNNAICTRLLCYTDV